MNRIELYMYSAQIWIKGVCPKIEILIKLFFSSIPPAGSLTTNFAALGTSLGETLSIYYLGLSANIVIN